MDLTAATACRADGAGRFLVDIPDGWQQGRGAYGGLALGMLARAMATTGDRPLRSLTAVLPAPTPVGPARIEVGPLRVGTGVSTIESRLVAGDGVTAHAVGVFGRARDAAGWCAVPRPSAPPADAVPELSGAAFAPPFTQHWRYYPLGPPPFSGGAPEVAGWLRARDPGVGRDAAFLVAAADVWWPAAFAAWTAPRPMATVAFTLQILVDPSAIDPSEPLLHVGRTEVLFEGYTAERRELWTADGRLACINQQTFAVL